MVVSVPKKGRRNTNDPIQTRKILRVNTIGRYRLANLRNKSILKRLTPHKKYRLLARRLYRFLIIVCVLVLILAVITYYLGSLPGN